jgi:hypothetical protein
MRDYKNENAIALNIMKAEMQICLDNINYIKNDTVAIQKFNKIIKIMDYFILEFKVWFMDAFGTEIEYAPDFIKKRDDYILFMDCSKLLEKCKKQLWI